MQVWYKGFNKKMDHNSSISYQNALTKLNDLQSNADTLANWIQSRKLNPNQDLKPEMDNYLNRLHLNVRIAVAKVDHSVA
jgi:hypothetical protein